MTSTLVSPPLPFLPLPSPPLLSLPFSVSPLPWLPSNSLCPTFAFPICSLPCSSLKAASFHIGIISMGKTIWQGTYFCLCKSRGGGEKEIQEYWGEGETDKHLVLASSAVTFLGLLHAQFKQHTVKQSRQEQFLAKMSSLATLQVNCF